MGRNGKGWEGMGRNGKEWEGIGENRGGKGWGGRRDWGRGFIPEIARCKMKMFLVVLKPFFRATTRTTERFPSTRNIISDYFFEYEIFIINIFAKFDWITLYFLSRYYKHVFLKLNVLLLETLDQCRFLFYWSMVKIPFFTINIHKIPYFTDYTYITQSLILLLIFTKSLILLYISTQSLILLPISKKTLKLVFISTQSLFFTVNIYTTFYFTKYIHTIPYFSNYIHIFLFYCIYRVSHETWQ